MLCVVLIDSAPTVKAKAASKLRSRFISFMSKVDATADRNSRAQGILFNGYAGDGIDLNPAIHVMPDANRIVALPRMQESIK